MQSSANLATLDFYLLNINDKLLFLLHFDSSKFVVSDDTVQTLELAPRL